MTMDGQIAATTLPFGEVTARLDAAERGISALARRLGVPGDTWRSLLAELLGIDGDVAEPVSALRLGLRTTLLTDVDPDRRCFLVLEGRFDEYRLSVRAAVREPGQLLGCLPLLSPLDDPYLERGVDPSHAHGAGATVNGEAETAAPEWREGSEVRTTIPSLVVPIEGARFVRLLDENHAFARVMLRYIAELGGDYLDDHRQYDEAFEQYFPGRSGMLTPPPYEVEQADMRVVFCKKPEDPALLQQMLPPSSRWYPGLDFYLLVCSEMKNIAPKWHPEAAFNYDEVAVFVPAQHGVDVRLYFHVPFMFPDNIMAIYLGREILGLPKRRSANFRETICAATGNERFLMRRMLPEEARERRGVLGYHHPKQIDVLDMRWTTVPGDEEGARLGELVSALFGAVLPDVVGHLLATPIGQLVASWIDTLGAATGRERPLSALRDSVNAMLPHLPEGLRTVNATAWKRIFAPEVRTDGSGEQPWRRRDFEVDAVACTPFPISKIHHLEVIDTSAHGGGGLFANRGFPIADLDRISPYGLRLNVAMSLQPGRVIHNFRRDPLSLTYRRRRQLAWGPHPGDDGF